MNKYGNPNKHKKRSVMQIAMNVPFSEERYKKDINRNNIYKRYGIITCYDECNKYNNDDKIAFSKCVTQYSSIVEYQNDLYEIQFLVNENKPIPSELDKKLLITKQELEKAGLLEKFACI